MLKRIKVYRNLTSAMQITTEEFKQKLARVDWYYHYLERGYMEAQRYFNSIAVLAKSNPEWVTLWEQARPNSV